MFFNSFNFLIFFIVVFVFYWISKTTRHKNYILLISSYFFYAQWDIYFLLLIIFSSLVDFKCSILIYKSKTLSHRKIYLFSSLFINFFILFIFKYFNFFSESLFHLLGIENDNGFLLANLILPVGISFYTFQSVSYTIDVYNKRITPTFNLPVFLTFVSYFPQLVAGPIERANNLLFEISKEKKITNVDFDKGLRFIIYGLFKKIVIADNIAPYVDRIFNNYENYNGGILLLGIFYFSIQIYCDFSGYSNIAVGVSKLLGIKLNFNFNFPYRSKDITEFWQRWHISLSIGLKIMFIFLLVEIEKELKNVFKFINCFFIVRSLAWSQFYFYFLGFIPCAIIFVFRLLNLNSKSNYFGMLLTYSFVTIGWVFFRSEDLISSLNYLNLISSSFALPNMERSALPFAALFFCLEFFFKNNNLDLKDYIKPKLSKFYELILFLLIIYLNTKYNSTWYKPQKIKVKLAPCQRPDNKKTINKFKYVFLVPFLFPPRGI